MIEKKYLKMMKALLVPVGPRATSGTWLVFSQSLAPGAARETYRHNLLAGATLHTL
jgi:hypothetical protein